MSEKRTPAQVKRDVEELGKLSKSRGWAVCLEVLEREEAQAIRVLTGNPMMAKEELDFHRASLRAIRLMISLPDMIKPHLETEYRLLEEAQPTMEGIK